MQRHGPYSELVEAALEVCRDVTLDVDGRVACVYKTNTDKLEAALNVLGEKR